MESKSDVVQLIARLDERLDAIDQKLDNIAGSRRKSIEWIAQMSEQVRSLDEFREEVRASLEPLFHKIDGIDEVMRIMRHATADVSRRIEEMEGSSRKAG